MGKGPGTVDERSMSGACRNGDIGLGICPAHLTPVSYTTTFIGNATTVLTNGQTTVTIGAIGISTCGHPTIALTGSSSVNAEGNGIHRIGDSGQNPGPYTAVTGSTNVIVGG